MNLVAISPATKTVALGGAAVEVTGLSMRKLTQLIVAYPELVGLAAGGRIDIAPIILKGPEMGLAIFSLAVLGPARVRFWQNLQTIKHEHMLAAFDKASAGQQIEILGAIVDLTFKGGERAVPLLRSVAASLVTSTENSSSEPAPSSEPEPTQTEPETSQEISPSSSSG